MYIYHDVGALDPSAAEDAIAKPLRDRSVRIEPAALGDILSVTQRYPYFLQEWGKEHLALRVGEVG